MTQGATPHHHPLPVEGRPQPTRLRSVARTVRKPPRPARKAPLTVMPAAPAVYCSAAQASRLRRLPFATVAHSGYAVCPSLRCAYTVYALGMACWEFDVHRSGRFLAAARTPLRQMGCYSLVLVRGLWWGVGVLAALTEGQRARLRGDVAPPGFRAAATRSRAALRIPEGIGARDGPETTPSAQSGEPERVRRVAAAVRAGATALTPRVGAQPLPRPRAPERQRPSPWTSC